MEEVNEVVETGADLLLVKPNDLPYIPTYAEKLIIRRKTQQEQALIHSHGTVIVILA